MYDVYSNIVDEDAIFFFSASEYFGFKKDGTCKIPNIVKRTVNITSHFP